jgi:pimeloyl-ACP methyl ester carboxylesterase
VKPTDPLGRAALAPSAADPADAAYPAPDARGESATPTRFLDRPGGRIAYEETGSGPLVVLLPGIGDLRQVYRFLAPRIAAAGYRVVSMDLRGLGESSTGWDDYTAAATGADVLALVRELDAGPAHLVGNSAAAGAVVWAAAEAPELVRSLVLAGPFVRAYEPSSRWQRLAAWGMVNLGLRRPWGTFAWDAYYRSLYPTAKPADLATYRDRLKANLGERGRLEAVRAMFRADNREIETRLGAVRAPTLVVMGTKDPDFAGYPGGPEGEADRVAERLGSTPFLVEGAGHYPQAEMPDQVGPAVIRFLAGSPVARGEG